MRSRAGIATVGSVVVAAILITTGLSLAQSPRSTAAKLQWAMARSSLENVSSADAGQASRDFNSPTTLIQNSSPLQARPTPPEWRGTNVDRWTSFAQFASDVRGQSVPGYVQVVHYDNEAWPQTPAGEQLRPGYYEKRFCNLAHRQGWNCFAGPAQDLCGVLAHPRGERYAECYIRLNLAGKAARYADIVDIQAQALEVKGAKVYAAFVRRAASQARAANPDVIVLGNITPSPGGAMLSAPAMLACAKRSLPYVRGFYTTVNADDGAAMVSFLKLLDS